MPRKTTLTLLCWLLVLTCLCAKVAAQTTCVPVFLMEHVNPSTLQTRGVKMLPDGTTIVTGRAMVGADFNGFAMRVAPTGETLWMQTWGAAGDDELTSITLLSNGNILLYGHTAGVNAAGKPWMLCINPNGVQLWDRVLRYNSTSIASMDRLKAVIQFTDGDLIGTFNIADSSAASDPVVFKMGLDGTLRWIHRFDNGGDDSFTTLAFNGLTIYAGGYYTATTKRAVITQLSSVDGSLIASRSITNAAGYTPDEEIRGLEIYDNLITYGLMAYSNNQYGDMTLFLKRTDLQGNPIHTINSGTIPAAPGHQFRRSGDGYILFCEDAPPSPWGPHAVKIDGYGNHVWGRQLNQYYFHQVNRGFDITPDGGIISAGYYATVWPVGGSRMQIARLDAYGEGPACLSITMQRFTQEGKLNEAPFTWANVTDITAITAPLLFLNQPYLTTETNFCQSTTCFDRTPLPPDCNKTYRIEYDGLQSGVFRDAVATADGGRIVVGSSFDKSVVTRVGANGDVIWSKTYGEVIKGLMTTRILPTADGNFALFARRAYTINHGAYNDISIIRIDIDGNILAAHIVDFEDRSITQEFVDVTPTPDGGFVMVINDGWGSGGIHNYVVRFDAAFKAIWKKELKHAVAVPVYRSVACWGNSVFLASDAYDSYHYQYFGLDRLDLATGQAIWNKEFRSADGDRQLINKLFAVNDTAYVFLNQNRPTGMFTTKQLVVMVRVDPQGNLDRALDISNGNYGWPNVADHNDISPPSVTYTTDNDFVLAMRSEPVVGSKELNITRFTKEGNILWSVGHPVMSGYDVFNIKQQAKGFVLMGRAAAPRPQASWYYNGFVVKVDSAGQIVQPNTGSCATTPGNTQVSNAQMTAAASRIDEVEEMKAVTLKPQAPVSYNMYLDATLHCYEPAHCQQVALEQLGKGCTITDTMVYYLRDAANCGAVAHWTYDVNYFKATVVKSDTLRLVPFRTGASTVQAVMEGYCFTETKTIQASVLISAANMKLAPDTELCEGATLRISAGPGYASYQWNNLATDSFLVVDAPGKYFVDVTDNCGGTGTDTIVVAHAGAGFGVAAPVLTKCNDDPVTLQAVGGFTNYRWTAQQGTGADGISVAVNPAVSTKYYVEAEKYPGCRVRDSVMVDVLRSPDIVLPADAAICRGDSVLLDAGPSFASYTWNTGATTQWLTAKATGQYKVVATWPNGCQSKDSFALSFHRDPAPALDKSPVLCKDATRLLTPGQFAGYQWSDGSTLAAMPVTGMGKYWVTVTDGNGCKAADTTVISTIAPLPANFLPAELEICQYGDLKIIPSVSYKDYKWSDQTAGPMMTITRPGEYWLQATDRNNCTGSDTVKVVGKECLVGLYIPNAFTPNGDGNNDVLTPLLYGHAEYMRFVVYNRWGQQVFGTRTMQQGWDGKIGGQEAVPGTYVWQCRYKLAGMPERFEKGIVQLIR